MPNSVEDPEQLSEESKQLARHIEESNLYLSQLQERYQAAYLQIMELILNQAQIPKNLSDPTKSESSENRLQQALITQLLIEDSVLSQYSADNDFFYFLFIAINQLIPQDGILFDEFSLLIKDHIPFHLD